MFFTCLNPHVVRYNLSAEISQVYFKYTYVKYTCDKGVNICLREQGGREGNIDKGGDKRDSYIGTHELLAPGPQLSEDVEFLT